MYYHNDGTHRVDWTPEHTSHALTAMQEVVDELYSEGEEPIEVDKATANAVNVRYEELVAADPDINPPET